MPDPPPATRPTGPRARRRTDIDRRILEIGRQHLVDHGAAALSLRAVARDLGMVSSAVYRYIADRDALLTVLVADAYTELGDAVDEALAQDSHRPWDGRLLTLARTVRTWALAEPARYALLYGSPVPGYAAPAETTVEPGTRVVRALLALLLEGVAAGEVSASAGVVPFPRALRHDLARVALELGLTVPAPALGRGILVWSAVFGAVSLEVFGQFGEDTFGERTLLFDHQVQVAVHALRG